VPEELEKSGLSEDPNIEGWREQRKLKTAESEELK
jgi:hypothetical protein